MEKFKKQLRSRIIYSGIYCVIIILLNILAVILKIESSATAFALGFSVGIGAIMVFFMAKYQGALKSEEKLKQLYIEENDERQKYIDAKIGGVGNILSIMLLALATIVSNYFNKTVFFTLLATLLFLSILRFVLKIYYDKKL